MSDVHDTLSVAIGGSGAGQVFEGIRRFDIYVRLKKEARDNAQVIQDLILENAAGQRIPLEELASIEEVVGPRQITRENNRYRYC